MQGPTAFQPIQPQFPEQEQLNCPRCDSPNTKFCYYNNYNLSQPRHFCKNCKRYWTKGGSLRNIPVGGGSRKNTKRSSTKSKSSASASASPSPSPTVSSTSSAAQATASEPDPTRVCTNPVDIGGGISSPLTSNEHLGELLGGVNSSGLNLKMGQVEGVGENASSGQLVNPGSGRSPGLEMQSNRNAKSFVSVQNGDSSCWNGNNGWSNLTIYTPGSSFQ